MRGAFFSFLIIVLFTLFAAPVFSQLQAAVMLFNPTTGGSGVGQTFTVQVTVDAKAQTIAGVEAYVMYDASVVEPQSVTAGDFFPIVTNNIVAGKVNITGVVENSSQYKSGTGTIATITFKGIRTGTGVLRYDCDLARSDASKIVQNDLNATNLIECASLGTMAYTISSGTGTSNGTTNNGTNNGTTNNGTTNNGTTTYATNSGQLMKSGVFDNVVRISIPALILVGIGVSLKLILLFTKGS